MIVICANHGDQSLYWSDKSRHKALGAADGCVYFGIFCFYVAVLQGGFCSWGLRTGWCAGATLAQTRRLLGGIRSIVWRDRGFLFADE